jgi:hypothetical protein
VLKSGRCPGSHNIKCCSTDSTNSSTASNMPSSKCTPACPHAKTLYECFGSDFKYYQQKIAESYGLSNRRTKKDNIKILSKWKRCDAPPTPLKCSGEGNGSVCVDVRHETCDGFLLSGKCPGSPNIKCCSAELPKEGVSSPEEEKDAPKSECTPACPNANTLYECFGPDFKYYQKKIAESYGLSNRRTKEDNIKILSKWKQCDAPPTPLKCSGNGNSSVCVDVRHESCDGFLLSGRCPGSSSIKCCSTELPKEGIENNPKDSCPSKELSKACKALAKKHKQKCTSTTFQQLADKGHTFPGITAPKSSLPCLWTKRCGCIAKPEYEEQPNYGGDSKEDEESSSDEEEIGDDTEKDEESSATNSSSPEGASDAPTNKCTPACPNANTLYECFGSDFKYYQKKIAESCGLSNGRTKKDNIQILKKWKQCNAPPKPLKCSGEGKGSVCVDVRHESCDGALLSGKCPGSSNIKCCSKDS